MSITFLQLINKLLCKTGQTEVLTLQNASTPAKQAILFLNDTMQDMASRIQSFQFLQTSSFSTTAGIRQYSIAVDPTLQKLISNSVRCLPGDSSLQEIDPQTVSRNDTATGKPRLFYRFGNTLCLFPVPNQVYTIQFDYLAMPSAMTTDQTICPLPDHWETGLLLGAQSHLERFLGESYQDSYLLYEAELAKLKKQTTGKPFYRMQGPYRGNA
jgi:hypothetical protein